MSPLSLFSPLTQDSLAPWDSIINRIQMLVLGSAFAENSNKMAGAKNDPGKPSGRILDWDNLQPESKGTRLLARAVLVKG